MTFAKWAKLFTVLGWINTGLALFNTMLILLITMLGGKPDLLIYLCTGLSACLGYVMFWFAAQARDMSEMIKEEDDESNT